jgi:hypothetical protein
MAKMGLIPKTAQVVDRVDYPRVTPRARPAFREPCAGTLIRGSNARLVFDRARGHRWS